MWSPVEVHVLQSNCHLPQVMFGQGFPKRSKLLEKIAKRALLVLVRKHISTAVE